MGTHVLQLELNESMKLRIKSDPDGFDPSYSLIYPFIGQIGIKRLFSSRQQTQRSSTSTLSYLKFLPLEIKYVSLFEGVMSVILVESEYLRKL